MRSHPLNALRTTNVPRLRDNQGSIRNARTVLSLDPAFALATYKCLRGGEEGEIGGYL